MLTKVGTECKSKSPMTQYKEEQQNSHLQSLDGHMTDTAPRERIRQEHGRPIRTTYAVDSKQSHSRDKGKLVGVSVSCSASRIP